MIEKYFLNTRGQVRLLIIGIAVFFCQAVSFLFHLPSSYLDILPFALIASCVFVALHIAILAIFNYFYRHPIIRYSLLGLTFEILLVVGYIAGWYIFNSSRVLTFNRIFEFYISVHQIWETWYFIITPSIVVVVSAMVIEFKAARYYSIEVIKNKIDHNILDDIT